MKIADLGNACWVVSVEKENSDEKIVQSCEILQCLISFLVYIKRHFDCRRTSVAHMTTCWPG